MLPSRRYEGSQHRGREGQRETWLLPQRVQCSGCTITCRGVVRVTEGGTQGRTQTTSPRGKSSSSSLLSLKNTLEGWLQGILDVLTGTAEVRTSFSKQRWRELWRKNKFRYFWPVEFPVVSCSCFTCLEHVKNGFLARISSLKDISPLNVIQMTEASLGWEQAEACSVHIDVELCFWILCLLSL